MQVVSGLQVTEGTPKTITTNIIPVAPFLLIAGDLGDPFHSSYQHFLSWASCNWERVIFIAGASEYGALHDASEVETQCRFLASNYHNVRFLQQQVITSIPGIQIIGASLYGDQNALIQQTNFLQSNMKDDSIILTYGCVCNATDNITSSLALQWVCGSPCELCKSQGLIQNIFKSNRPMYDASFYITIPIKASTFYFIDGNAPFPDLNPVSIPYIEMNKVKKRQYSHPVCFYCGHSNHTKMECPLIQCNACGTFGHTDKNCTRF